MSGEMMEFPKRWEQFLHDYEFEDSRRIYTNGARLEKLCGLSEALGCKITDIIEDKKLIERFNKVK